MIHWGKLRDTSQRAPRLTNTNRIPAIKAHFEHGDLHREIYTGRFRVTKTEEAIELLKHAIREAGLRATPARFVVWKTSN